MPLLRTGSDTARRRRTLRLLTTAIREVNEYADVTVIPVELTGTECSLLLAWLAESRPLPTPTSSQLGRSSTNRAVARARRLSVEHRNTVAPRVDDVLDTLVHVCASRFAVDPRHEQGVVVGVDMADGGNDGEAYSVAVQGSPGGASSHPAAAACRCMKCDRLGAVDRTPRELLPDGGGELTAEVHILIGSGLCSRVLRRARRSASERHSCAACSIAAGSAKMPCRS